MLGRTLLAIVITGLSGCVAHDPPPVDQAALAAYLTDKPEPLRSEYQRVFAAGTRDGVLARLHLGRVALEKQLYDEAITAFDEALAGIETIYAETESAEKARSLWQKEAVKDFKGEPYERVMAYYYRGLLYLRDGDYENAQASFKSGMLQDSFAESERYRSDWALAAFMEGWANKCIGNTQKAEELLAEAVGLQAALQAPAADDTALVVVESGSGPVKLAQGQYKERLVIAEGRTGFQNLHLSYGDRRRPLARAEDVYWQASTRGGRPVDAILAGKAEFKDSAKAVGNVAVATGAATMYAGMNNNNRNAAAAGAVVALVGLLAHAASAAAQPEADTRTWVDLPHSVFIATMPAAGLTQLRITDDEGRPVIADAALRMEGGDGRCRVVWYPASGVQPGTDANWTPAAPAQPAAAPGEGNCQTSVGIRVTLDPKVCSSIGGRPVAMNVP